MVSDVFQSHRPIGYEASAPAWFLEAIANEPQRSAIEVRGAAVETLCWGSAGKPGVLLLHGHSASADWWSFVAPLLAHDYRVCALSWSGMGRSQWRKQYDFATYVEEAFAAVRAHRLDAAGPPVFVGHSFGGTPVTIAASLRGHELKGAVLVDCFIPEGPKPPVLADGLRPPRPHREPRSFATFDDALRRFRFLPAQTCDHPYIVDFIARHSIRQTEDGGYAWRTDPNLRSALRRIPVEPHLANVRCRLAYIAGSRSLLMTDAPRAYIRSLTPSTTRWIEIDDAGHHVMVDQPIALANALKDILRDWTKA